MSHYYCIKDGKAQRYIQLTKDGRESQRINKKQMIADGAVVGTTDALKVLGDVGGLLYWTSGLGIQAGIQAASEGAGEDRAREIHKELSETAANRGTQMHDAIDAYLTDDDTASDPIDREACLQVENWLAMHGAKDFQTEHCFVWRGWINIVTGDVIPDTPDLHPDSRRRVEVMNSSWIRVDVGGTSDFVSDTLLCDWKSVEQKRNGFRSHYLKECCQLALYRLGFGKPKAECHNIYLDRASGLIVNTKQWTEEELRKGLVIVAMAFKYIEIAGAVE
jgi:hypothetical protein